MSNTQTIDLRTHIKNLDHISVPDFLRNPMSTGIEVIDTLINGTGPVRSQLITLDASRGSGKTTLLLQIFDSMANTLEDSRTLYISREEPAYQLKNSANRLHLTSAMEIVGDETDVYLEDVINIMDDYDIIALDSFSCLESRDVGFNDKARIKLLKQAAKEKECCVVLILHQTKGGESKGSSDIEHMVDTCISIARGDDETFGCPDVRILTVKKNRFGSCGDIILQLKRNGWDFDNPLDNAVNNEANKKEANLSPQAKKPAELKLILKFMKELEVQGKRLTLEDINCVIPEGEDDSAFGRFSRHMTFLCDQGLVLKFGDRRRGETINWELTQKGRDRVQNQK